jgi:hypothetical protein
MRSRYLITVVLVLFAAVWATAQSIAINKVTPTVISGENVGFRVEGLRGGSTPVGRIVVKVNGQWAEAELAGSAAAPLSTR